MNLVQLLSQNFARYRHKPVIIFGERTWIYQDFERQVTDYASMLHHIGIKPGDRIAIQMPKSVEFLFLHLAILSIGAISLPLNPDYRGAEIAYFLADSTSNLLFTTSDRLAQFQTEIQHLSDLKIILTDRHNSSSSDSHVLGSLIDLVSQSPQGFIPAYPSSGGDIAMICYTSGTTGRSKGAMISHRNLIANMEALHEAWQWQERDRLLHVLPLFHVHGLNVAVLGCLYAGATMIMVEKFDPNFVWRALEKEQISVFMAVPTIYQRLINSWQGLASIPDLSKVRLFISGSAPLSDRQFNDFEKLTNFRILERYGMTETGMNASNPIEPELRLPKSVGFPLKGVEIQIVDSHGKTLGNDEVGEVWIRGENVFQGYWQMLDKTTEAFVDGWFRSGDLGYLDPLGRLHLVSRAKELIITGGFNVYPKEVENVIESHESVKESAVIGIPDQDFGEKVVAAIAFHEGLQVPLEDLIKHCKSSLAPYKCPKHIFEVPEIPRNAMGKIQKHLLKLSTAP
ncbi:MAG: o-succinylbenzoate--CoA ligase [Oscillatoriales cyanobacterium CG2_30_44_21]|nr:MAG: o-succinylbenzoate--CoA ligase [Oscillatoriales cyanobacterium CG2_30_44_21]